MSKEKILILSVGGSEEPLIYSINEIKPKKVVFLHSTETFYQCGKILEKAEWKHNDNLINGISFLFKNYKNNLFKIFRERLPDFLSYDKNNDFYVKFIDFLDKTYFKGNGEVFITEFLDFLNSLNIEKNYYNEFSKLINDKKLDSEKLFSDITNEYNSFKEDMKRYLRKNMTSILEEENLDNIVFHAEIKDHESLDNSFTISKKVFNKFNNEKEYSVNVDFTGGTKPMVSGIVLSVVEGNFKNFKIGYVGSKNSKNRTKNGLGIVENGSEITKLQCNPYEKYGIKEFERGKEFFDNYQFESARFNFKNACKSLEEGPKKELSKYYMNLSNFYQNWNKFNEKIKIYNEKLKKDEKIKLSAYLQKELIENCPKNSFLEDFNKSEDFLNQMNKNLEFLRLKLQNDKNKGISYYLPDLLNNAYRKIEKGYYDDGVARLYRALELIAQIELNKLEIIDQNKLKNNKVFHINKNKFDLKTKDKSKIREEVENWDKSWSNDGKTFKIALNKSYELLKLFDVELGKKYKADKKLNSSTDKRNNSILAHGLEPLNKESAEDFYEKVLSFSVKVFPKIEENMEKAKFPKFK